MDQILDEIDQILLKSDRSQTRSCMIENISMDINTILDKIDRILQRIKPLEIADKKVITSASNMDRILATIDRMIVKLDPSEIKNSNIKTASLDIKQFKNNLLLITNNVLMLTMDQFMVGTHGTSNLHIACAIGNIKIAENIIEKFGVNVIDNQIEKTSPYWPGYTPLHCAIQNDQLEMTRWLIRQGANVNIVDAKGARPLHIAFDYQRTMITRFLLSIPEIQMINHVNTYGLSYFHIASSQGHYNLLNSFLKEKFRKVHVNTPVKYNHPKFSGYTPLHFAVENGYVKIVKLLLNHNAVTTIRNNKGLTPLHLAFYNEDHVIVWRILLHQRDYIINPIDNNGLSHFHIACIAGNEKVVMNYLNNGHVKVNHRVNENAKIWSGCTALHMAIDCEKVSMIKQLLLFRADPNIQDSNGMTALHFLCRFNETKLQLFEAELRKGNTKEIIDRFYNDDFNDVFNLLLKYGADIDLKDKFGKTSLMYLNDFKPDEFLWNCSMDGIQDLRHSIKTSIKKRKILALSILDSFSQSASV